VRSRTLLFENSADRPEVMSLRTTSSEPPARRRADAQRNVELILDAAERCLGRDPDASMSDIATAAGLGRVTIYGHFKSRPDLIEAVARRVLAAVNDALEAVDLSGDPAEALTRYIDATWALTVRSGRLLIAADKALPATLVRDLHGGEFEARLRRFIGEAQRTGAFRPDLPTGWLFAAFHAVVHAAANEVEAGRLDADQAAPVITATMLGIYTAGRQE
jgi:TetR/AcrR family transcriptional regulator, mexCD-oprJ operon repressor